ncbi:MAG: sugar-binding protein [Burkholderiales bacterium]|nr:sugar-binding protein [Opitutaceae bacterium]
MFEKSLTKGLRFSFICIIAVPIQGGPIPAGKPAHYPTWWFERDLIPRLPAAATNPNPVWPGAYPVADDYVVANLGQLKHVATQAAAELNSFLPGGAGSSINNLVASWHPANSGSSRDDYAAVNQGQLKFVAAQFYNRLTTFGYAGQPLAVGQPYPWTNPAADDDSYTSVNLGQLKYVFSFNPKSVLDTDSDGLLDAFEIKYFGSLLAQSGFGNPDGDAYDNATEQRLDIDPLKPANFATASSLQLLIYTPN